MLARHLSCAAATMAVYSRDLLSPVLRELDNMLQAMRCSLFHPDRTRSGMVTPSATATVPGTPFRVPPAPATPAPVWQKPVEPSLATRSDEEWELADGNQCVSNTMADMESAVDEVEADSARSVDDSETSENASEQSTSDSEVEVLELQKPPLSEPALRFFINEKSLVIHCERVNGLLRCGRKISPHFSLVYELHGIRCSKCFDV